MSSIVNKVKDAMSSDRKEQPEGTHGPHNTRTANAADPRVDSDRDHRAAYTENMGTTGGEYTTGGNYGAYGSEGRGYGTDGPATRTDGPHKSNVLNKADPRVDSDRDYSRNMGANPHGTSGTGAHNVGEPVGSGGAFFNAGNTRTGGVPEGTAGPHNSRMANAADPRVDSDLDNTRRMGGHTGGIGGGMGATGAGAGMTGAGAGMTGTHHGHHGAGGVPEGTAGPHNNRMVNAADPRIDSDLDNNRRMGGHTGGMGGGMGATGAGTGMTGAGAGMAGTHHGQHGTAPTEFGSSTGGASGMYGAQATGTGPAPNTAGPHKSDMMNKLDPRVDSNLDGSKTMGREKTFDRTGGSSLAHKDPTDAAQVPPSVLQQHVGQPEIAHDDVSHERQKRHSISHQEQHRGL